MVLVSATLAPLKLGVGVRGATEQIGRKLQRLLQNNPEMFVLQIDLSNAFNSVYREALQEGVSTLAPSFYRGSNSPMANPRPCFVAKRCSFLHRALSRAILSVQPSFP